MTGPRPPVVPPPTVSVIVAVHDVAGQVAQAIASLRAQTLPDFEALVVDDGSTDGSGPAAAAAMAGDPRFRLIRQDNRGLGAARNAGLALARGRWLAFLDGDDLFAPGFLERLIVLARATGLPWAASALDFLYPDGRRTAHSGLHGTPDPAGMVARVLPLTRAPQVARVFPSAWTKVYDRDFFGTTRFPEGCWYEDHEVWWDLATRAGAIAHCPEPLVLHRRGREGQITGADDERVFDQFAVLDRLAPRVRAMPEGRQGLELLAGRLIHERAGPLHEPARRARFLRRAADWLAGQGLGYDPGQGHDLSRALAPALAGQAPVVLAGPGAGAAALPRDARRLDLPSGATDLGALARALPGPWLLLVPHGERPDPGGIEALVEAALRHGADLALGMLRTPAGHHDGWIDNRLSPVPPATLPADGAVLALSPAAALRLHPSAGRMLVGAGLLARLGRLSVPLDHPLAGEELLLRAALAHGRALVLPQVVAALDPPTPPPVDVALRWARGLDPGPVAPPQGWRTLLALRALRPRLPPARSLAGVVARLALATRMARHGLRARSPEAGTTPIADPGTDRLLARLVGLGRPL